MFIKIRFAVIFILGVLFTHGVLKAQSLEDDLKLFSLCMPREAMYHLSMNLYSSHSSTQIIQQSDADYKIWGPAYARLKMGNIEVVKNDKFNITVNHRNKTVLVNKSNPDVDLKLEKLFYSYHADSIIAGFIKAELLDSTAANRTWRFYYKISIKNISHIDITINRNETLLKKITLYYSKTFMQLFGQNPEVLKKDEKPRMEIEYSAFQKLTRGDIQHAFSVDEIITYQKKQVQLTDKYKGYRLYNYYLNQ